MQILVTNKKVEDQDLWQVQFSQMQKMEFKIIFKNQKNQLKKKLKQRFKLLNKLKKNDYFYRVLLFS